METLVDYLNDTFGGTTVSDGVLKYFYEQLYSQYSPDITGYTFVFMVPPDLSGYRVNKNGNNLYSQVDPSSYMGEVGQLITFAAVDFTPPQSQVNTETISSRSGAIPYATEVSESEQCSVTYVDNSNLDVYMFHHLWIEYIREILEGVIEPSSEYITPDSDNFGAIDYAGSLYVVKYRPDMKTITFVAKCMGVFPQSLPAKELIGTRTSNELATLPFTYFCTAYREATAMESGNWIITEVEKVASKFSLSWQSVLGIATGALGDIMGTANTLFQQQITSITEIPNKAVLAGLTGATNMIATAKGNVLGGLGTVSEKIMRFPQQKSVLESPSIGVDYGT